MKTKCSLREHKNSEKRISSRDSLFFIPTTENNIKTTPKQVQKQKKTTKILQKCVDFVVFVWYDMYIIRPTRA